MFYKVLCNIQYLLQNCNLNVTSGSVPLGIVLQNRLQCLVSYIKLAETNPVTVLKTALLPPPFAGSSKVGASHCYWSLC